MNEAFKDHDNGITKWKEGMDRMIKSESARWKNVIDFAIELELSYCKPRNETETEEDGGNVSSLTFSHKKVRGDGQLSENQSRIDGATTAPLKYESTDISNISESAQQTEEGATYTQWQIKHMRLLQAKINSWKWLGQKSIDSKGNSIGII